MLWANNHILTLLHHPNRHEQASISSLSEATQDCVVCNSLKCVFTLRTQEFKEKTLRTIGVSS